MMKINLNLSKKDNLKIIEKKKEKTSKKVKKINDMEIFSNKNL